MSASPTNLGGPLRQSGLELLEQATELWRRAGVAAGLWFAFGIVPSVLAHFLFADHLLHTRRGLEFLPVWAVFLTGLWLWSKFAEARCCAHLWARWTQTPVPAWSGAEVGRVVGELWRRHLWFFIRLPLATITVWAAARQWSAAYTHLAVLWQPSGATPAEQAWPRTRAWSTLALPQVWGMGGIVALLGLLGLMAGLMLLQMLPDLLHILLGWQTQLLQQAGARWVAASQLLVGLASAALWHALLLAAFVIRAEAAASQLTGDDLWRRWRALAGRRAKTVGGGTQAGALALVALLLAGGVATVPAEAQTSPGWVAVAAASDQPRPPLAPGTPDVEGAPADTVLPPKAPKAAGGPTPVRPPEVEPQAAPFGTFREALRQTLERPAYQERNLRLERAAGEEAREGARTWWRSLRDWWRDLFRSNDPVVEEEPEERPRPAPRPMTPPVPGVFPWLPWVVVAVLVVGLGVGLWAWWQARRTKRQQAQAQSASATEPEPDLRQEQVSPDALPTAGWLDLADKLAAAGDYRLAMRAIWLSVLSRLAQVRWVELRRAKTNHEYRREVYRRSGDTAGAAVATLLRQFETVWYGRGRADAESFQGLRDQAAQLPFPPA